MERNDNTGILVRICSFSKRKCNVYCHAAWKECFLICPRLIRGAFAEADRMQGEGIFERNAMVPVSSASIYGKNAVLL